MHVRREVEDFTEKMEFKLSMHDDRPGWKECDWEWLLGRLREETYEIEKVLRERGDGWITKMWQECADVANFAMMIQDAETFKWARRKAIEMGDSPLPE